MNLRLLPLLICFAFNIHYTAAQISIGDGEISPNLKPRLKEKDIARLQRTTTIVVCPDQFGSDLSALEAQLKTFWKITPIKLIRWTDAESYAYQDAYSFFAMTVETSDQAVNPNNRNTGNIEKVRVFWNLYGLVPDRKFGFLPFSYARIDLSPGTAAVIDSVNEIRRQLEKGLFGNSLPEWDWATERKKQKPLHDALLRYVNSDAQFTNGQAGVLLNQLRDIHDQLKPDNGRWLYRSIRQPDLGLLLRDTLWIPEPVFNKNKPGKIEAFGHKPAELLAGYPYPYAVISADELGRRLLQPGHKRFFYLQLVYSWTDRFMAIYDSATGATLFADYKPVSGSVKENDFSWLGKEVKRMKQ